MWEETLDAATVAGQHAHDANGCAHQDAEALMATAVRFADSETLPAGQHIRCAAVLLSQFIYKTEADIALGGYQAVWGTGRVPRCITVDRYSPYVAVAVVYSMYDHVTAEVSSTCRCLAWESDAKLLAVAGPVPGGGPQVGSVLLEFELTGHLAISPETQVTATCSGTHAFPVFLSCRFSTAALGTQPPQWICCHLRHHGCQQ